MVILIFLSYLFAFSCGSTIPGGNYGYPKENYTAEMLGKIKVGAPMDDPVLDDIHYYLFTRDNPTDHEELLLTEESISGSHFDKSRERTVFLTHGFGSTTDEDWEMNIKTSLLSLSDHNIILVDWRKHAAAPYYFWCVEQVPVVANQTAALIGLLADVTGLQSERVMFIGHSLGAHVAGDTGMACQQSYGLTMGNIIGIDPAGPEYHTNHIDARLDPTDADFVVVLHANGGDLLEGCIGYYEPCGHVDFYPNGGKHQPGCTDLGDLFDLITGGCSHHKSHEYIMEGIPADQSFMAWACTDWEDFAAGLCDENDHMPMGYFTKNGGAGGTYYLAINENSPYSVCC